MAKRSKPVQESLLSTDAEVESVEDIQKKEAYRRRLAEKLKDPEFRRIEGFPIGTDEAILALSDPPYYTACPNPFLPEILEEWQKERREIRKELGLPDEETLPEGFKGYHREPFAADVSEGKNDPIYNAHSYHTKVPHKAIMRYILHYTDPGDIVFDGFCGTGMTGVAAQLCGDKKVVESLGYRVDAKGVVYDGDKAISRLGARKAVLNDLSPAATFIAYNYNTPVDARAFDKEARCILDEVEQECGWMYETTHTDGSKGRINYVIWSEVYRCSLCGTEMTYWDAAVSDNSRNINTEWYCPNCSARLSKNIRSESGTAKIERVIDSIYDRSIGKIVSQTRQLPVLINYTIGSKRYEKRPDKNDLSIISKIDIEDSEIDFPIDQVPFGDKTNDVIRQGLTNTHHFFTKRNLITISKITSKSKTSRWEKSIKFLLTSFLIKTGSKLHNVGLKNGKINLAGAMPNAIYLPSFWAERNITELALYKLSSIIPALLNLRKNNYLLGTKSTSSLSEIKENSIQYIFIDPPFGSNLMYSELNFLWESFLKVFTNNNPEAIINRTQKKVLHNYQQLITYCFNELYRILEPNHWITVEFHNSQNSVWNSIQEAMLDSGFVVADVSLIDKQQGTYNQMTSSGAVKQDLTITAYKPNQVFDKIFKIEGGNIRGAWEFIRQHLEQLPTPVLRNKMIEIQAERMPFLLYDRMVAFHLVRGLTVPLSAAEFYKGCNDHFLIREGMVFTAPQVAVYDQLRLKAEKVQQLPLFINDENSAIQWLRAELNNQPQTYGEIQPKFMPVARHERYENLPELDTLLEQNFLQDDKKRWYVPNPDKAADMEALRERELLREFKNLLTGSGRIRVFRSESVKAGFSKAWGEHDYATIIKVAERLPVEALQEDAKLKLYYDNARNRAPRETTQGRLI